MYIYIYVYIYNYIILSSWYWYRLMSLISGYRMISHDIGSIAWSFWRLVDVASFPVFIHRVVPEAFSVAKMWKMCWLSGALLSHEGYNQFSSIYRWDSPSNKPSIYWGTPILQMAFPSNKPPSYWAMPIGKPTSDLIIPTCFKACAGCYPGGTPSW